MKQAIKIMGPWAAVLVLCLGAIQSLIDFRKEFETFGFSQQGIEVQIPTLGRATERLAGSLRARRIILDTCDRGLRGPYGAFQPSDVLGGLARSCAEAAATVLRSSPTDSVAYLVAAEASLRQQDQPGFVGALTLAQRTAPSEGWLAERRLDLIGSRPGAGLDDPALRAIAEADLRMLFQSDAHLAFLARLRTTRPALRALVVAIAETLPNDRQRRFLQAVRAAQA